VEDEIPDAVEIGYDGFTVDGAFPTHAMMAYEVKDAGMVGTVKVADNLAQSVKLINSKITPLLKTSGYRGFLSTEIRQLKTGQAYFIDPCCRLGTPSNELLQELFDGWPQVVWDGADGICTTPKTKARFGCLAIIASEWAVNDWLSVSYPRKLDDFVKLRFHVRKGEKDYVVPQIIGLPDVGCVVGTGETLQAAVKSCKDRAKEIKGFQLHVNVEAIDKGLEVIEEGKKFGIQF
jgi:hypothetical protein